MLQNLWVYRRKFLNFIRQKHQHTEGSVIANSTLFTLNGLLFDCYLFVLCAENLKKFLWWYKKLICVSLNGFVHKRNKFAIGSVSMHSTERLHFSTAFSGLN